jgi:hypothetical protein
MKKVDPFPGLGIEVLVCFGPLKCHGKGHEPNRSSGQVRPQYTQNGPCAERNVEHFDRIFFGVLAEVGGRSDQIFPASSRTMFINGAGIVFEKNTGNP